MSKKAKVSRNKKKADSFFGSEPVITDAGDRIQLINALNWYRVDQTPQTTKKWLTDFLKKESFTKKQSSAAISNIKQIHPTWLTICRLHTNGSELDQGLVDQVKKIILEVIKPEVEETPPQSKEKSKIVPVPVSPEVLEYFDDLLSKSFQSNVTEDVYDKFKEFGLTKFQAEELKEEYQSVLSDIELCLSGDKEMLEGYSQYSKKQLKSALKYLTFLQEQVILYKENKVKRARVVRKKRAPNKEKMVSKLKFLRESVQYKLVSIDPLKIIGAKKLAVFNEKTKEVSLYYASEGEGFSVRGTSLKGYDEELSLTKKVRKPETVVSHSVFKGFEKALKTSKTVEKRANGRFNDHTIILKVWN